VRHEWQRINDEECRRFQSSIELVGKRWSSGILLAVAQGATRFTEIIAAVSGLSDRLLAQRIKELQTAGLLEREVIPTTPVQVRYHLTTRGADLMRALQPLGEWSQRWAQPARIGVEDPASDPATPAPTKPARSDR
jgi:DNA-binding HxlR family transcriptional regulator